MERGMVGDFFHMLLLECTSFLGNIMHKRKAISTCIISIQLKTIYKFHKA